MIDMYKDLFPDLFMPEFSIHLFLIRIKLAETEKLFPK